MLSRLTDRRSVIFAFTAWMCVALHLAVFTASGWHFHGPHEHGDSSCGSEQDHGGGDPCSDDHAPGKSPRDGRDPGGCDICKAILVFGHAAPLLPVVFDMPLHEAPCASPAPPRVTSVAALRRPRARGPPVLDLVSFLPIL